MSSKKNEQVILKRNDWKIEINPTEWAEILLYLVKNGWNPSVPSYYFLGQHEVNETDAVNLRSIGQAVLNRALEKPLAVYPVSFNMGKLAEIVVFCEDGGFQICRN